MLIYGHKLSQVPIIDLSSGSQIATTSRPVIDWTTLRVVGLLVDHSRRSGLILTTSDIREYNTELILVNSEDDLIEVEEIIRLRPIIKQDFRLIGAHVKTESGASLGSVSDYSFDPKTFIIQQLYTKRSLIKSLLNDSLVIERTQIVDITPPTIIVRDASIKEPLGAISPALTK